MKFNFSKIKNEKLHEVRELKERRSLISSIEKAKEENSNAIIAEIKRRSPASYGKIKEIDLEKAAREMEVGGACAISVLTDKHFAGSLMDLKKVKKSVKLPVLRKDFIVDEFQLYESYVYGADAVLLIAALLKERTKGFVKKAKALGMETLVEIHSEDDLKFALDSKARLIGINNRNLKTLKVELSNTEKLIKKIKKIPNERRIIKISESGIKSKEDLGRLFKAGADAALIGTAIMKAKNIEEKTKEFVGR